MVAAICRPLATLCNKVTVFWWPGQLLSQQLLLGHQEPRCSQLADFGQEWFYFVFVVHLKLYDGNGTKYIKLKVKL